MRFILAVCVLCAGGLLAPAAQAAIIGKATVTARPHVMNDEEQNPNGE